MLRFVPLGGYLGAGKTTTMLAVARRLEAAGERVGVITNDQGVDLVDTALARDRVARRELAARFRGSASPQVKTQWRTLLVPGCAAPSRQPSQPQRPHRPRRSSA